MFLARIRSTRQPFLASARRFASGPCLVAVATVAWLVVNNAASARARDVIPPTSVRNLTAASTSDAATLSWRAATDNRRVTGYEIFVNGNRVRTVTTTRYTVGGLTCAREYLFGVRAVDGAGNRSRSTMIIASTKACASTTPGEPVPTPTPDPPSSPGSAPAPTPVDSPPTMPTGLWQQGGSTTTVVVGWQPSSDDVRVTAYEVYRDGGLAGLPTGGTTYTVTGLACGVTYTIGVKAFDDSGNGSPLATLAAATSACPALPPSSSDTQDPTAPTSLAASAADTSVALSWHAATDNVAVTGYKVWQGSSLLGQTASLSYPVSGLTCGTSYTFHVAAADAAGNTSTQTSVTKSTTACAPPTQSGADFYLSPNGSDSSPCSQASPCLTLNRAYHVAGPGKVVQIAGGTYGAQDIRPDNTKTSTDVVLRAAPGATPSFAHVDVNGSHITFDRVDFRSGWTVWDGVSDVTFLNTTGSYLYIFGGHDVSVLGGSYGPSVNTYSFITAPNPGAAVPTNILFDGVRFHDYSRSSTTNHTECLHAVSVQNLTIRNSRFENCAVMGLFLTINPNSAEPFRNLTIENNFFGRTTSGGYYSVFFDSRVSFDTVRFRYNSLAQSPIFESGSNTLTDFRVEGNVAEQWSFQCNSKVTYSRNVWFDGANPNSTVAKCGATDVGYEAMSDPGWVDMAANDLHLRAGSPVLGATSPSTYPATDIDGQARSAPTTVGADQP